MDVDHLLKQRERRAIVVLLVARALFVVVLSVPDVLLAYRLDLALWALGAAAGWIALNGALYWLLRRGTPTMYVGLGGLVLDLGILSAFLALIGSPAFPIEVPVSIPIYIGLPLVLAALIVLHGMSLRPFYPMAMAASGLVMVVLGLVQGRSLSEPPFAGLDPQLQAQLELGLVVIVVAIGAGVTYSAYSARRLLTAGTRSEAANSLLRRYFSPQVVQGLSDEQTTSPLADTKGRVLEAAVMFCDIRGFTRMTEEMPPEEVMAFLREYHGAMIAVIFDHGGTIDKFIGDAIMVTFGTPHPASDDATRAHRAGKGMMAALDRLNARRAARGEPPIAHDIAIHFGPVVAGSIGTDERREYTVLGDVVNTASRMESLCKSLNEPFLVSGAVRDRLTQSFDLRALETIQVRGRVQELALYAVDWQGRRGGDHNRTMPQASAGADNRAA